VERERRGWREGLEPGIYRSHRVSCDSSADHREGRRCSCPLQVVLATGARRSTWATIEGGLPEARRARARAVADVGKTVTAVTLPAVALDVFAAEWFASRETTLRPATLAVHRNAFDQRIAPALGSVKLDGLTRERIEAWLSELVRRDSHRRSIEQATETLRAMLSTAVAWDRIPTNPALRLRMPKRTGALEAAAVERVLQPDAIVRMLAAAGSLRNETLLRTAVEVGLRKGELIGLRWSDVDLEARRIRVAHSVWQGKAGERVTHSPKSGHSRRVAISETLAQQLGDLYRVDVIDEGADAAGLVWPGRHGKAMGRGTPSQLLARVLKRAKLPAGVVTIHGLRHTAAARAFARGVPLLTISRQLGHATPAVTARVYAHLASDGQLDAFADAMEAPALRDTLREAETVSDPV
jgi:integrase